jgi:hypothetical protein
MTETEKMEKHITSLRRLGEVLHKSIGSEYHAISLQLGGGFPGWMPHPERPAFLTTWPGPASENTTVFAPGRYATSPGRDCSRLCEKRFCLSSRRNSRSVHGNGFAVKSEGERRNPKTTPPNRSPSSPQHRSQFAAAGHCLFLPLLRGLRFCGDRCERPWALDRVLA